jgi:hypothetical protein
VLDPYGGGYGPSSEDSNEPSGSIKGGKLTSRVTVNYSRSILLLGVNLPS